LFYGIDDVGLTWIKKNNIFDIIYIKTIVVIIFFKLY